MENKYYLLYSTKDQKKLLTSASSLEEIKLESEYYSEGVWFEYDQVENSNLLKNEKELKGIKFPKEPKERSKKEWILEKNWLGK